MEDSDPYNLIKAEIDTELQAMTSLQAKLFAGHGEVAGVLNSRLEAAAERLSALESAVQNMVANPPQYGLTAAAAFGRQVEVETLRYTLTDLQETCSQAETSSSGRPAASIELPTIQPPGTSSNSSQQQRHPGSSGGSSSSKPAGSSSITRLPAGPPIRHSKLVQSRGGSSSSSGGQTANGFSSSSTAKLPLHSSKHRQQPGGSGGPLGDGGGDDTQGWGDGDVSYEAVMQQQMRQQDEALDHISIHVDRIKHTGQLMHEELEEQAGLLSGLQEDTDTTHLRLRGLRKKVSDVIKQSRTDRQLCLILALSAVLIVLTVLAIA